jgi:hypothetical protein
MSKNVALSSVKFCVWCDAEYGRILDRFSAGNY